MSKPFFLRMTVAVGLSACALAYSNAAFAQRPRPPPTPASSSETSASSTNDPLLAPPPPAPRTIASWSEAISLLRERSTDLKIAYADVKRAEGDSRIALAGMLPTITGTGLLTHNILNAQAPPGTPECDGNTGLCSGTQANQVLTPTYVDGEIVGVMPLFVPRVWHQIGTASEEEDVAKLGVDAEKRKIVLGVATALVGVVTAERIAELNRNGLRVSLQRYDLAMQKKTIGGGTQLDVLRARADADSARTTVVSGDEGLRQSREALGLALGTGGEVGVSPGISLDSLEASARGACRATSIEDRADVAAARGRLDLAERGVTDVKWQFAPTVSAQSTMAVTSIGVVPNPLWNIQGVLSVPIWDGGARYGMLTRANADADEAEARLTETQREVGIELAQARRGVEVATAQRRVVSDAREAAKETDDLTQLGFRTGQGTSLELVIAAAQLRQAEINLALGDFQLVRARVAELLSRSNCPF